MRIDLGRTGSWSKSLISDCRNVSKGGMPMNVTNLEEHRFICNVLITREDHNLIQHKGSCVEGYLREIHRTSTKWQ